MNPLKGMFSYTFQISHNLSHIILSSPYHLPFLEIKIIHFSASTINFTATTSLSLVSIVAILRENLSFAVKLKSSTLDSFLSP